MKYYSLLLTLFLSSTLMASDGSAGSGSGASDVESSARPYLYGPSGHTDADWEKFIEEASAKPHTKGLCCPGGYDRFTPQNYIDLIKAMRSMPNLEQVNLGCLKPLPSPEDSDKIAREFVDQLKSKNLEEVSLVFPMSNEGLACIAGALSSWPSLTVLSVQSTDFSEEAPDRNEGIRRIIEEAAKLRSLEILHLPADAHHDALVRELDTLRGRHSVATELSVAFQVCPIGNVWYKLPLADEAAASGGGSAGGGGSSSSAEASEGH